MSGHALTCAKLENRNPNKHGKGKEKKKVKCVNEREGYHEAASSRTNRTPPTGARKAAATPAAAPQVIMSLRSRSFLKYLSHFQVKWYLREPPCPSKLAMQAPVWTIGPSLPTTKPAETPRTDPKICQNQNCKHHRRRFTWIFFPLIVF